MGGEKIIGWIIRKVKRGEKLRKQWERKEIQKAGEWG